MFRLPIGKKNEVVFATIFKEHRDDFEIVKHTEVYLALALLTKRDFRS
ncbi:MAG: hypothetical protein ACI9U0_001207 [Flavobacteriales bacterium]|jgi:hypothetical protein|tara:strand:- start:1969 stop:2112 length:144 start_codon:yes stop_codon:yes gene_type:complete